MQPFRNTWTGSSWDGKSKVNIRTPEQDANGNTYYIYADFRKYPCIEDSIKDRCAYLLGAKNGSNLRYAGIKECRDYREQITLIKNGGYATDVKYIDKICDIIKRFDLARFDKMAEENKEPEKEQETKEVWYRVRLAWGKTMEGQIEAYHDLNKAKEKADQNPGYKVFDENGKVLYPEENETILSKMAGYQKQFDKDKKDGKKWTYKTSGHSKRFTDAVKDNNRVLNCSLLVQWALRDLGLLDNSRFWGKVHGTLTFRETSKEQILKHFDLIDVAGKKTVNQLIKSGNLKPGDIVSYWDVLHMNIYAGNNKWYDGGHANCSGQGEGAVFKTWFGTVPYGSSKVGCILRRKNQTIRRTI